MACEVWGQSDKNVESGAWKVEAVLANLLPGRGGGNQSVKVPKILNDTFPGTKYLRYQYFFSIKFFRYRFRDFFLIPNFTHTGFGTFFLYQFFLILVPRLFQYPICQISFPRLFFRYQFFPIPPKTWKMLVGRLAGSGPLSLASLAAGTGVTSPTPTRPTIPSPCNYWSYLVGSLVSGLEG